MTYLFWVGFCVGCGVGIAMYALCKTLAERAEIRKQVEQEQKEIEELMRLKVDAVYRWYLSKNYVEEDEGERK